MFQISREYIRLKGIDYVICINRGAYLHTTKVVFLNLAEPGSSNISEDETATMQTISIDEMLDGKKATYIKMDIESSEMTALEGE